MKANEHTAVAAKPSSTVVVLRQNARRPDLPVEILMVKRRGGDAFGDSYVFPGGVVDHDELTSHDYCHGMTAEESSELLGVSGGGLDFYSAAIRELFEETGVLLAKDAQGNWASGISAIEELRVQVDKGQLPWRDFLHGQGLQMSCDSLHYFAHWETPFSEPKRWSTRFFLAEMPSGQEVQHDGSELTDSRWLGAAEALSIGRDGGLKMPYPTVETLKTLSEFASIDELLNWAHERTRQGVEKILPVQVGSSERYKSTLPGDPDYPAK